MSYDDEFRRAEYRREDNRLEDLKQDNYRADLRQQWNREDQQWDQKRLNENLAEAHKYQIQRATYLSLYKRDPRAAEAYAQRMRENLGLGTSNSGFSSVPAEPTAF